MSITTMISITFETTSIAEAEGVVNGIQGLPSGATINTVISTPLEPSIVNEDGDVIPAKDKDKDKDKEPPA